MTTSSSAQSFTWGEDAARKCVEPEHNRPLHWLTEKIEQVGPMSIAVTHDEAQVFLPLPQHVGLEREFHRCADAQNLL